VGQQFDKKDDAYFLYKDYAKLAGFSLQTARTSKETNHWVCNREGWHGKKGASKDRKGVEKMRLPGLCEGQKGCEAEFLVQ
jgi:hypothetical protein